MNLENLPPFVGTLPGWITSIGVVSLLAIVARVYLGRVKLAIDATKVKIEDEENIRDHYASEVAALRSALQAASAARNEREREIDRRNTEALETAERRYKAALEHAEEKHEQCKKERDELRDDGRGVRDIVAGLIRIITQASASRAILLSSDSSDYIRDAAQRINMLYAPGPVVMPASAEEEEE